MTTRKEVKHNIMSRIIELQNKGLVEEDSILDILNDYLEPYINDLEKENAELKKKLKPENCLKLLAKEGYIKFTSEQLTKAKELLKQWLSLCGFKVEKLSKDTERFLKENEK